MAIDLISIQKTIGYDFDNDDLLQQAFVRRSYSEENGGQNNEVLEFIGDKALDLAVIRIMMDRFGTITEDKDWKEFKLRNPKYFKTKLKEGNFTDIKKDLVEKKALSKCMDRLGFHTQLIMGKGDINQNIQEQDSVKEDLFEAILGAVALDSDWDMDSITDVVTTMIDFDDYFNNENSDGRNFVGKVQEWSQQNGYGLPEYQYEYLNYRDEYQAWIYINGTNIKCYGTGSSEAKARMDAAANCYQILLDNDLIENEFKNAVGEADYDRSLAQINELVQKHMIDKPIYEFTQEYDEDGNAVWHCDMSIDGVDEGFTNSDSVKKEAQRKCAYEMLLYLMDEYEEDEDYE